MANSIEAKTNINRIVDERPISRAKIAKEFANNEHDQGVKNALGSAMHSSATNTSQKPDEGKTAKAERALARQEARKAEREAESKAEAKEARREERKLYRQEARHDTRPIGPTTPPPWPVQSGNDTEIATQIPAVSALPLPRPTSTNEQIAAQIPGVSSYPTPRPLTQAAASEQAVLPPFASGAPR